MKSHVHANNSAKKFGGKAKDYLAIHEFLDSSKNAFPDVRHRTITHTTWFIASVVPRIFGKTIKNSAGKRVSTESIAEQHVLEDFGGLFIPDIHDYLAEMELRDWMDNAHNGNVPPSRQKAKHLPSRENVRGTPPQVTKQQFSAELLKTLGHVNSKGGRGGCAGGPPGTYD